MKSTEGKQKELGKKVKNSRNSRRHGKKVMLTPRKKVEQLIGYRLLTGKIPVIQQCQLTPHTKAFDDCCKDFASGKMTEAEAVSKVTEILKGVKKVEG